jgi:hypothetical protein
MNCGDPASPEGGRGGEGREKRQAEGGGQRRRPQGCRLAHAASHNTAQTAKKDACRRVIRKGPTKGASPTGGLSAPSFPSFPLRRHTSCAAVCPAKGGLFVGDVQPPAHVGLLAWGVWLAAASEVHARRSSRLHMNVQVQWGSDLPGPG